MKKICKYSFGLIVMCCIVSTIIMLKENDKKRNKSIIENPVFLAEDDWGEEMFPDISFDKDSKNLVANIENEKFFLGNSIISVSLANENEGIGFYFYGVPAVEKKIDDKWIRLSYKESDPSREQWCVCALENSPDVCFSTTLSVDTDNINDFTEGSYRMVVFLTDRNIYVPFEVIGEK